jgi:hypothetical protein
MGWKKLVASSLLLGLLIPSICTLPVAAKFKKSAPARFKPTPSTAARYQVITYTFPQENTLIINLHPGLGTNISFEKVGQTIETIFINNKSFYIVSTNGCMTKNCPPNSAPTMMNISTIDRTEIPGSTDINQEAGRQGLLTIVTKDGGQKRYTHTFAINAVGKNSRENHVALLQFTHPTTAPTVVNPTAATLQSNADKRTRIDNLVKGLGIAVKKREVSDLQLTNTKKFILAINTGNARFEDGPTYGLDLVFLAKLVSLGSSANHE